MSGVTLENIVKRYGSTVAVDDISLNIKEGEFLTLSMLWCIIVTRIMKGCSYGVRVKGSVDYETTNFDEHFESFFLFFFPE